MSTYVGRHPNAHCFIATGLDPTLLVDLQRGLHFPFTAELASPMPQTGRPKTASSWGTG